MDPGGRTTGTRDEHYDLISVLYHALEGADTCDTYALDADATGHADLYEFFREAQVAQTQLAERAKELLGIGEVTPGAGGVPPGAAPPETEAPSGTPPRGTPGDVLRGAPPEPAPPQEPPPEARRESPPPGPSPNANPPA